MIRGPRGANHKTRTLQQTTLFIGYYIPKLLVKNNKFDGYSFGKKTAML